MKIERLVHRRVGATMREFRMIGEGDRVLIAVSGGVDSLVLARILAEKKKSFPFRFELCGCHVSTDIVLLKQDGENRLDEYFSRLGISLTHRFAKVLGRADATRPINCFFCAMQRRKALIEEAKRNECNKIAYGHHMDDVIETLLMNMFYNAEISTMPLSLELDNHDLTIIRPLGGTKEQEIRRYASKTGISAIAPPCPFGETGKRASVKRIIAQIASSDERVRDNIAASLKRVKTGYLTAKIR